MTASGMVAWPQPQSLYVHIPFCRHRCGYCNFSVIAGRDDLQEPMVNAIVSELESIPDPEATLRTIFLGGGTPTHLRPDLLDRLFGAIGDRFDVAVDAEITAEANPEDITTSRLHQLAENGVNRLSMGVQSFDAHKLNLLQRSHDERTACRAVEAAAKQIGNVSIDLIFGAPDESDRTWRADLMTASRLPIDHVSTYALTFEKGTQFWNRRRRGDLRPIEEQTELDMDASSRRLLPDAGFDRYEISNFARPDRRCRHNIAYWRGQSWYGVGPGAASFLEGVRTLNHRSPTTYLKRVERHESPVTEREMLTADGYARERAAFGIRMVDGVDTDEIRQSTGIDVTGTLAATLRELIQDRLIWRTGHHMALTDHGLLFADMVASRLLFDEADPISETARTKRIEPGEPKPVL